MNKLLMAAMDTYQAQKTEALAHLDLLRHDLENDIIQGKTIRDEVEERMLRRIQFNRECG